MKWDPFHFGVTVDLAQGKIVCPKQLFDALDQRYHVLTDGASEQIDSAIIVLGPGMQTCMRLCEKQKTGKTMGAELVKALVHNRQAAFAHGLRKQRVCPLAIHEDLMVALERSKIKCSPNFKVAFTYTSGV